MSASTLVRVSVFLMLREIADAQIEEAERSTREDLTEAWIAIPAGYPNWLDVRNELLSLRYVETRPSAGYHNSYHCAVRLTEEGWTALRINPRRSSAMLRLGGPLGRSPV